MRPLDCFTASIWQPFPSQPDSVLSDRYQLVELGSTRQLVIPNQVKSSTNDALLFGGIRYEADTTVIRSSNTTGLLLHRQPGIKFFYADSTLRSGQWNYLPFTEKGLTAWKKCSKGA
ncbi:MAG: hypothetical protein IPH31_18215 [Lewinellaceae bacterium]|nr:hypothetical protein [Lewinellaceae bacterium]